MRSNAKNLAVLVLNGFDQVLQQQPNRFDRWHAARAADIRVVFAQLSGRLAALAGKNAIMVSQVDESLLIVHESLDGLRRIDGLHHENGIYGRKRERTHSPR